MEILEDQTQGFTNHQPFSGVKTGLIIAGTNTFRLHAVGREGGREEEGRGGHSLQSCEKSLVRGKVKVGEAGLVTTAGAELMPLDTTEDAGTWRARKSAPGLVGSSVGGVDGRRRRQGRRGEDGMRLGVRKGKQKESKKGLDEEKAWRRRGFF